MADLRRGSIGAFIRETIFLGQKPGAYIKGLLTPFNLIAFAVLGIGLPVIIFRFAKGLGASTNLSQINPWGIWIGFDLLAGVALAAGGYTIAATVYIFGLKKYYPILRPAVLTGFLGYLFVVIGLICDLGRPWRLPYPLFYSQGVTSVMFEVGWCVLLYFSVQFLELCPAFFEWLGWKGARAFATKMTIGVAVFGVLLSTLHQSSLGALFLMAPTKLHPLWYSPFIPVFFYGSSIIAGLTMVIVESTLTHKLFRDRLDPTKHVDLDELTLGLGKAAAVVMFSYFFLKLLGIGDSSSWHLLRTPMGAWFLVELLGFIALPCALFAYAARNRNVVLTRVAAVIGVTGVVVNRLNVSVIAFNWNASTRYVPHWMEIVTSVTIVMIGLMTFRWLVNRVPVLAEHPAWRGQH
ncbi:MAG TPA: NrfD/PsrC family molybdoenzyme membrane anchor subunit [Polyangia bacterium]|jgi:Ni/Fe-hydrogenase subunit HybB-like protein